MRHSSRLGELETLEHALRCPAEFLPPGCQASPSIPLLEPRPNCLPPSAPQSHVQREATLLSGAVAPGPVLPWQPVEL